MNKILSIIFLHWVKDNGPMLETLASLESIYRYITVPYELILVSNGSSQKMLNAIADDIERYHNNSDRYHLPVYLKAINLQENLGVSKGFNAGLKAIAEESKYISIYANDWVCSPNWAELMIEELDKDKNCGFVTCCTNIGTDSNTDDPRNPVAFTKPVILPDDVNIFKKVEKIASHTLTARGNVMENRFPCMGWTMKREVFDKVGFMDERIFCANDVSYGLRARQYGYTSKTVWAAFIYHFWHASFSQINDRKTYSYLRPKDEADLNLINDDKYHHGKFYLDKDQIFHDS